MNLAASLPSAPDRIAPIAALVAVVLHAAAAWLAWITPGATVLPSPMPLEVRFLPAPAIEATASPPRSVGIPPPALPAPTRPSSPAPLRPRVADPEPGPAALSPSRTLAAESPAPALEAPVAPAVVAAPAAPAVSALPAAAPVEPAAPSNLPAIATASAGSAAAPAVSAPRFDAAYLSNPPPAYPVISRRLGEEGRVLLRVFVEADGWPSRVEVRESSGHRRLDDAAQAAVQRWRFVPARRGDSALAAWVLVPVNFTLKSA